MNHWKNERFVVIDPKYYVSKLSGMVLLTDLKFWADHADQLREWCLTNQGRIQGMTVEFDSKQALTLFVLRWS